MQDTLCCHESGIIALHLSKTVYDNNSGGLLRGP